MGASATILSRRWNAVFVLVALGFILLAGVSAFQWHSSDRVFTVDADGPRGLAAQVSDAVDTSEALGARGLIVDSDPESGDGNRPAATADAGETALVLLGDAESTPADVSLQLTEIAKKADLNDVVAEKKTTPDDAAALVGGGRDRVAPLPTGIRSGPRYLAWRLHPGLVVLPLTVAAALVVVVARRWWHRVVAIALLLAFITFFNSSINFGAALAVGAACLALAATAEPRSPAAEPHPSVPEFVPPPSLPSKAEPEPPPAAWESPDALLVIGSPSRVSAQVGLAPADQTHCSMLESRWFHALGVSAAGARHLFEGQDLEDFHAVHVDEHEAAVMVAIADGTSHASHASSGSRLAADAAIAVLRARPPAVGAEFRAVADAIASADAALASHARGADRPLGALATTLLVAFGRVVAGQRTVTCARVGDSEAFLLEPYGWRRLFDDDDPSTVRESSTATIPSPHPTIDTVQVRWPDDAVLVLATDGVADPLIGGRDAVRDELQSLWATRPTLADFTRHVQFSRRGIDDDRTTVAVWPRPAASGTTGGG